MATDFDTWLADQDPLVQAAATAVNMVVGGSGPKSLLEESINMDPDTVILSHEERMFPPGLTPEEQAWATPKIETVVDLTVGDVFNTYYEMTDAERRNYQERLYAAGMYSTTVKPHDIYRDDKTISAIKNAIEQEGNRGRNPLDIQAPDVVPEVEVPEARGYTAAQLDAFADEAARRVLGRRATSSERATALGAWRAVEGSALGSPQADMEAALRRESGSEARRHALGDTLRSFMQMVNAR